MSECHLSIFITVSQISNENWHLILREPEVCETRSMSIFPLYINDNKSLTPIKILIAAKTLTLVTDAYWGYHLVLSFARCKKAKQIPDRTEHARELPGPKIEFISIVIFIIVIMFIVALSPAITILVSHTLRRRVQQSDLLPLLP